MRLKHNDDIAEHLALDFTIDDVVLGKRICKELKENGKQIMINEENKLEYIQLYSDFLLNKRINK